MIQSDASSAVKAAPSVLGITHGKASREGLLSRWRDQKDMDSGPHKRTTQEYGYTWAVESVEVTPETGRVNERRLSEADQVSPFPGSPEGEDSSSEPRVGNAESLESLLQPGNGAAARSRAQLFQGTLPAQARLGNCQPSSHQSAPYSSPGYPSLPVSEEPYMRLPPLRSDSVQPAQQRGSATPNSFGRYASGPMTPMSGVSIPMNQGSFGSTGIGVGPPGTPSFSQAPSQTSSESRLQTGAPTYRHSPMRRGNTAVGVTTASRNQQGGPVPVSPFTHPGASLSNSNARIQAQEEYRTSNRRFAEEMGVRGSPALPPRGASDLRHPRSLQPGPPTNLPRPQHTMTPQSLVQSQPFSSPLHSNAVFDTEAARWERSARERQRRNQQSAEGFASVDSQQVEGPGPNHHHAKDAANRQIRRPTTMEADRYRMSNPLVRDEPTWVVKIYILMSRIMHGQHEGRPYTDLPTVTAEEMQGFRLQYRSTPVFIWPREYTIPDSQATVALQALKLLGLSLTKSGLVTQPTGPAQSATDTPAPPHGSARPGVAAQSDDDGHVPEYLLDQFIETLANSGEEEALRLVRESKAMSAGNRQNPGIPPRKRSNATAEDRREAPRTHEGFPFNTAASRARAMLAERGFDPHNDDAYVGALAFDPNDDDAYGGALAFDPMRSIGIEIDDDPAAFGITEIRNARGEIMVARSSRRPARNNDNNSPALNTEIIDIHIEDDLVGAAESATPVEKFRRLMNSSPTRQIPTKTAGGGEDSDVIAE